MKKSVLQIENVPWNLRFEHEKEARFRTYFYETNINFLRLSHLSLAVAAGIFNILTLTVLKSDTANSLYWTMLLIISATPLVSLAATYLRIFSRIYHPTLTAFNFLTTVAILVAVRNLPPQMQFSAYGSVLFLLLVNFGLMRQRFVSAVLNGFMISVLYISFAIHFTLAPTNVLWQVGAYFILFNCGGGAIAYLFDWSQRKAFLAKELIESEHERAESLLLNILPLPIADRLKTNQACIADHVDEVSVLFADIVGFTERAKSERPEELVNMLDSLFSDFDAIMEKHGIEKIKTIGDSYMAAAGLLDSSEDHCVRLAEAALDIMECIRKLSNGISLRIGMHRGPVVAGVIGKKKMIYDLWGDTVNIASRMETHSETGAIQVTEAFYLAVKDHYEFSDLRTIPVKGQGHMRVAFLKGRRTNQLAA